MLLGADELGAELVTAFQRLGAVVTTVDGQADGTAQRGADHNIVVNTSDTDELVALVEREKPNFVVVATADPNAESAIADDALVAIGECGVTVVPPVRSRRLSVDREGLRRLAVEELGLPTAPFWFAGSVEELAEAGNQAGCPLVVRPTVGRPGEGESVVVRPDDFEAAWDRAAAAGVDGADTRVMIEPMVDIDHAVTLLTVRGGGSTVSGLRFCEPIGHRRIDDDVLESWQPQPMTPAARDAAKSIAARIVNSLGGRGVCGVELLVKGDDVYFADISPWPCDSGLVTLRSQRLSEFELHARAVLGLPVDTIMITPGAADVIYASEPGVSGRLRCRCRCRDGTRRQGAGRRTCGAGKRRVDTRESGELRAAAARRGAGHGFRPGHCPGQSPPSERRTARAVVIGDGRGESVQPGAVRCRARGVLGCAGRGSGFQIPAR